MRTLRAKPLRELPLELKPHAELIHAEARRVIDAVGLKQFCSAIDQQASTLSHMLCGRGGRSLWLSYTPALVLLDPTSGMADALVAPANRMTVPIPEHRPEDLAEARRQIQSEHLGPEIHEGLERKAFLRAAELAVKARGG